MAKNKKVKKDEYGAKSIQVLEGLDPVRKRPGMYIGGTSLEGLHHLIWEVVNNSIDEAMAGFCDDIVIKLLPGNIVEVSDNGRGIPVSKHPHTKKSALETVMTMLHAGGKFEGDGYKISGGLHGVGVSVVNALSVWTKAEVYRDGKIWAQEYKRGKRTGAVKAVGKTKKIGTVITFQPDPKIFPEIKFSRKKILDYLRQQAYLTKGVKITIEDRREMEGEKDEYKIKKHGFYFDGGIISFVKFLNRGKEVKNEMPVYIEKTVGDVYVEVSLQYTDGFKEHLFSFANNIYTMEGGMHVTGFKAALTRALNDYAKKNKIFKEKEKNFTSDDAREGLTSVVSVKLRDPQFEGQTKAKLGNGEVRGIVAGVVSEGIAEFLEEHPRNAKAIIEKCLLTARARIAARAAKDAVIRKGALDGMTLPGKLADCSSKDASQSELYIVEGDSAGGCFSGDTKVALADGRNLSFCELIIEQKKGKNNFCYTIKKNGDMGIEKIKNVRKTKMNVEVVKVIIDNGEEIICTPDHLFMLRDGSYKKAIELKKEDSLMPLYKKYSEIKGRITIKGYEMVLNPKNSRWVFTHILSDKYNLENDFYSEDGGTHRHHIDFNKLNNNPDNLIRINKEDHLELHRKHAKKTLGRPEVVAKIKALHKTPEFREKIRRKMTEPKMRKMLSERAKKQWNNKEYKEFMKRKFLEFYNSNKKYREINNKLLNQAQKKYWSSDNNKRKQSKRVKEYFQKHLEQKKALSELSKKQWQDADLLNWRKEKTKEQWTDEFRKKRKKKYNQTYLRKALELMKMIYEDCGKIKENIYDIERRKRNDKSIIKFSTICDRFFNGNRKKLEEAVINFNHKIKAVKKMKSKIDVFDLEVPKTHNFALASGVFAHNSAKQGRDRQFQAILPLRGKLINVEKTRLERIVKAETLRPIIIALGVGIGENLDISKLRYHKIIIMADADVDGSHIRTLLLTFFYRYFEDLIKNGYVYIAQPPLYRISVRKKVYYVYTDKEKDEIMKSLKGDSAAANIQRYKGLGEMDPEQLWETTMNPENRMMLQVKIEDAEAADRIFDILMGSDVEPRRRFIQTHAASVKNLDV
ncbi:DNA topoisomerase (ATP-hydrolyzing) subunit B [bacterium]|nr:DNA topoisomerase (ATP-hydrolyzing) subunit B [bacterium]